MHRYLPLTCMKELLLKIRLIKFAGSFVAMLSIATLASGQFWPINLSSNYFTFSGSNTSNVAAKLKTTNGSSQITLDSANGSITSYNWNKGGVQHFALYETALNGTLKLDDGVVYPEPMSYSNVGSGAGWTFNRPLLVGVAGSTTGVTQTLRVQSPSSSVAALRIIDSLGQDVWIASNSGIIAQKPSTTISAASSISPATPLVHVNGTTTISTINVPSECSGFVCTITLIPDGAWATNTSGNIVTASTAVVSKPMIMTYDPGQQKWYASY